MTTLLEPLASYLPTLVLQHHAAGVASLAGPSHQPIQAALLFVDITGFTPLAERLAQRGPDGVEELSRVLNTSFGQILDMIADHGGDVIKFAGDALLALWPVGEDDLPTGIRRAAQCALDIQVRMASFYRLVAGDRLALRIGIAGGDLVAINIGGLDGRWEFLVTGEPLAEVAAAEQRAKPGQVVLAPSAWALVGDVCAGTPIDDKVTGRPGDKVNGDTDATLSPLHRVTVSPADDEVIRRQGDKVSGDADVTLSPLHRVTVSPAYVRLDAITSTLPLRPAPPPALAANLETLLRSYIPGSLLGQLVAGQTAWLAELRRVTVLFVNLPDADRLTLEQAQRVMQALQAALRRYEGSVNKISLDDKGVTLVAALGLPPLAHEDDPARGVQAALAIHAALRDQGLGCAIGVTSGRAFCGEIGNHRRREYTMIGDVVNLAARLMQAAGAESTGILCDEATALAARSRLALDALPPISIKGKAEPVAVYRPTQLTTPQLHIQQIRSRVDMVGRTAEQAILAEQLRGLRGGGAGGLVLIEGEAGMGKSCIVEQMRRLAADLRVTTFLGASDAMEQSSPYYAWRGIFSQLFDLNVLTVPEARRQHILNLLEDEPELLALAPLLNAVLPLELPENELTAQMTGQRRAEATRELLLRLLQETTARSPKLLILEDAHWFDSASWALALAAGQRVRALLAITLRPLAEDDMQQGAGVLAPPEYRHMRAIGLAHLRLDALEPEDALALVCRRLDVAALPDPVAALIREKAQGNPFFSEELAYALRDTGLIQIGNGVCRVAPEANLRAMTFPETVQGTIISRIDRLTPTQQLTLKVASVIGRVFPVRALQAVYPVESHLAHLGEDLTTLARLDITPIDVPEPDLSYIFKHAITHDVVYNLMLFAQRRQLHRAVAEWYEHVYADDLALLYPLLAYHWSKASVTAKALDYLERAGQHALSISAVREARIAFEQALELLGAPADATSEDQHRRMTLTLLMGETQQQLGDLPAARAVLAQSLELARVLDDRAGMIDALSMLGRVAADLGNYVEARSYLGESIEKARAAGDSGRLARALSNRGNVAMRQGAYAEVERYYQESLTLFATLGDRPGVAQALNGLGNSAVDQGMYETARYCYEESLTIRRALGDRWGAASCLSNLGWVTHLQHTYHDARGYYEESLAIARAIGDRRGTAIVLNNLGFTAYELRDEQAAAQYFDEALRLATEISAVPLQLEVLIGLARLRARAGHPEQAAELLGLALHHPSSNTDVKIQGDLFLAELRGALAPDRLDAALERGGAQVLEPVVATLAGQP